ncbi:MAG: carboxymuconolactone decarboxylase family protein [Bacteroidota bacterium]
MKTFSVPTLESAPEASRPIFEALTAKLGMVPNLYAVEGYSAGALKGSLDFAQALEAGVFSSKEAQAIYLAVSEVNQCSYCLAAHTMLGTMVGFSKEDTFDLRAGTPSDTKLRALTQLARAITETHGRPSEALVDAFFDAGYDDQALIELIGLVSVKTFSNYVHNLTQVPVDFPAAEPLQLAAA